MNQKEKQAMEEIDCMLADAICNGDEAVSLDVKDVEIIIKYLRKQK